MNPHDHLPWIVAAYWILVLACWVIHRYRARRRWQATLAAWALVGHAEIDGHRLPLPWDERWGYDAQNRLMCLENDSGHFHTWYSLIRYSTTNAAFDPLPQFRHRAYCREVKKLYYNRTRPPR